MPGIEYRSEKVKFSKGQIIAIQGTVLKEIFLLNEGSIEIKRCQENIKGFTSDEIIGKSKRIEFITGPSIFGIENILNNSEVKNSYIAMSDCEITKFIIPSCDFIGFFKSAPQIAMNVLLTMKEGCVRNIANMKNFANLLGEIDKLSDNLQLMNSVVDDDQNNELLKSFLSNGGILPAKIDGNFLIGDYSTILGKSYGDFGFDPKAKYDWKKIEFFHFLIKSRPDSFIQIVSSQIQVFIYIYSELSSISNQLSIDMGKLASKLEEAINDFFESKYSILNKILDHGDVVLSSDKVNPSITKSIISITRNIDHIYKKLSGKEHTEIFPKFDKLSKINLVKTPEGTVSAKFSVKSVFRPKLIGSKNTIIDFADLPGLEAQKMKDDIKRINDINFKDPTDKDSRKIIKELQSAYFKLFTIIVFKAFEDRDSLPMPVKLFLYFGYIDETLLNDEELDGICNSLKQFERMSELNYPILTVCDYLELVYKGDEVPGLSLNGEDFHKYLKRTMTKDIDDSPRGKVLFEIENMIKEGLRVTSDTPRAYIPFLSSNSFKGNISTLLNTPRKLETFVKKINDIDPNLFFRELSWKIPGHSELIRKEVKPYLILAPNSGIRVQLWQELVNNSRSSRGRFIIPVVFNGTLDKSLIHTFANFRWELNKNIAGASWMDPVEGGFVGAFYDFSQYYNKMSELSLDAKEEIKSLFGKIKMDRDRFAYFYDKWQTFEKDGIAKINKVVRSIFYRYIPFPKEIREKLKYLPLYEELDNKYNNIKRRELRSLEARYHKYADPTGGLPEDIQAYLDILNR